MVPTNHPHDRPLAPAHAPGAGGPFRVWLTSSPQRRGTTEEESMRWKIYRSKDHASVAAWERFQAALRSTK